MRRSLGSLLLLLTLDSLAGLAILSNSLREKCFRNPTKALGGGRFSHSLASQYAPTRIYSSAESTDTSNSEGNSAVRSISEAKTAKYRIPKQVSQCCSFEALRWNNWLLPSSYCLFTVKEAALYSTDSTDAGLLCFTRDISVSESYCAAIWTFS